MWHSTFDQRLASWIRLREQCLGADPQTALIKINTWWHQTPWVPYYLHWDDQSTWPDPWQLLDDNIYCPLARALGMLYTICMLDRADFNDSRLVETENDNLVQVAQGKYILNWSPDTIVNISLSTEIFRNSITQTQLKQRIR